MARQRRRGQRGGRGGLIVEIIGDQRLRMGGECEQLDYEAECDDFERRFHGLGVLAAQVVAIMGWRGHHE